LKRLLFAVAGASQPGRGADSPEIAAAEPGPLDIAFRQQSSPPFHTVAKPGRIVQNSAMTIAFYDAAQVEELLDYPGCIEAVRKAMIALSSGERPQPLRQIFTVGD